MEPDKSANWLCFFESQIRQSPTRRSPLPVKSGSFCIFAWRSTQPDSPLPPESGSFCIFHAAPHSAAAHPYPARMLPLGITPLMDEDSATAGPKLQRLIEIMARLRAPNGCPWDREQSFDTIKKYTVEETYEVLDAIDRRDWDGLREELGDFILQAVFYAQMASEEGRFSLGDCLDAINEKLIRRHPHIFAGETAHTGDQVLKRWEEIKAAEKHAKRGRDDAPQGLLDAIPRAQPALIEAQQISSRAARSGFDWSNAEGVIAKIEEEIAEFRAARESGSGDSMEDELGDIMFAVVNLARITKVDPEQALRRTNAKFRKRFAYLEKRLAEQGDSVNGTPIDRLEALWQEAKSER